MRRSPLQRASLATIVAVGAALAVVPGKVEAAASCTTAAPCVEVVVHRADQPDTSKTFDAAQLRGISSPQGQTSGATFEALGGGTKYPTVAVQTPGSRRQVEQQRPYEKAADGTYPYVFVDQSGAFGYTRPATAGDAGGTVKASAGQSLRVDLYETGGPLAVSVSGPKKVDPGKAVQYTASTSGASGAVKYVWHYSDTRTVDQGDQSAQSSHTFKTSRNPARTVWVEVIGTQDDSYGASDDYAITVNEAQKPTPTPTKRPTGNGSGGKGSGGGNGNGSGSNSPNTNSGAARNETSLGERGNGPLYGYGNPPTDPFAVPRGSRTLTETEIPSTGSFNGSQEVSGLILAAADVSAPLSDLDASQSTATTPRPSAFDDASPLAIALLAAGVLLVLIASAASELTGLSPLTRPRRTRRDR